MRSEMLDKFRMAGATGATRVPHHGPRRPMTASAAPAAPPVNPPPVRPGRRAGEARAAQVLTSEAPRLASALRRALPFLARRDVPITVSYCRAVPMEELLPEPSPGRSTPRPRGHRPRAAASGALAVRRGGHRPSSSMCMPQRSGGRRLAGCRSSPRPDLPPPRPPWSRGWRPASSGRSPTRSPPPLRDKPRAPRPRGPRLAPRSRAPPSLASWSSVAPAPWDASPVMLPQGSRSSGGVSAEVRGAPGRDGPAGHLRARRRGARPRGRARERSVCASVTSHASTSATCFDSTRRWGTR